jgi:hypothetical protein
MKKLTEGEKEQLWKEVREEFLGDEMMQEIHYVRLLHYHQTEKLSRKERILFYKDAGKDYAP